MNVLHEISNYSGNVSKTTLPITLSTTTSGSTIIVGITNANTGGPTRTVTGITLSTGSGTFAKVKAQASANYMPAEIWAAANITGGTTPILTATLSGAAVNGGAMYVLEVSGMPTTVQADGTNGVEGTSNTAVTTGTITTTNAVDIIVGVVSVANTPNGGEGGSWVADFSSGNLFEYLITSSTQTNIAATGTQNSAGIYVGAIAALKGAAPYRPSPSELSSSSTLTAAIYLYRPMNQT